MYTPMVASVRALQPHVLDEADRLDKMRKDFFEFLATKTFESERFMARLWRMACQMRDMWGEGDVDINEVDNDDTNDNKTALINEFMAQVERWQDMFRKIDVADPNMLRHIEEWKFGRPGTTPAMTKFGEADVTLACKNQPDKDRASHIHHWVQELYLRRLHGYWFLLTPKRVQHLISFLGAGSVRFMDCLSVNVSAQHLLVYEGLFDRVKNRRYQFKGRDVATCESTFDAISRDLDQSGIECDEDQELAIWRHLAPERPDSVRWPWQRVLMPAPQKVEIEFYWCGVKGLLSHEKTQIISALSVCDESSGVFKPIVCRAIFCHHWRFCHSIFLLDRALDCVSLSCLVYIAWLSKLEGQDLQHRIPVLMWIVALINLFMLLQITVEAITAFCQGITCWLSSYNLFLVGMELVSLSVLWQLCGIISYGTFLPALNSTAEVVSSGIEGTHDIFIYMLKTRPILFCLLILFKWGQFLLGFLVFDIGKTVLPAVYAMKSMESVKFVIYMLMVIFACTHAYWSLPLEAGDYEMSGKFGSAFTSFFRMFRLCVMGDFDIWELEGIDGVVDEEGYVDEPPTDWENHGKAANYHSDIRVITMMFGLVLTIMLMNMYIGVLSMAYEQFLAIKLEVFSHAKSKFMIRYLLRRHAWREIVHAIPGGDGMCRTCLEVENMTERAQIVKNSGADELLRRRLTQDLTKDSRVPSDFQEHRLPDRFHWLGFWTTVPQDLVTPEENAQKFQHMEDTQGNLNNTMDVIDGSLAKIDSMIDELFKS